MWPLIAFLISLCFEGIGSKIQIGLSGFTGNSSHYNIMLL